MRSVRSCVYTCVFALSEEEKEKNIIVGCISFVDKTGLSLWMLGLGVDGLEAEMNGLLALLFHQVIIQRLTYMFLLYVLLLHWMT